MRKSWQVHVEACMLAGSESNFSARWALHHTGLFTIVGFRMLNASFIVSMHNCCDCLFPVTTTIVLTTMWWNDFDEPE